MGIMKKLLVAIFIGVISAGVVSCGPSEEEKRKQEEEVKRYADSVSNAVKQDVATAMDSLKNKTGKTDSLVKVEEKPSEEKPKNK